jgi:hypothetical protein
LKDCLIYSSPRPLSATGFRRTANLFSRFDMYLFLVIQDSIWKYRLSQPLFAVEAL